MRLRENEAKLSEAMKANGRLQLLAENLKSQLDRVEGEAKQLRAENKSLSGEKRRVGKELSAVRKGWNEEQLKRKNLEMKVDRSLHNLLFFI